MIDFDVHFKGGSGLTLSGRLVIPSSGTLVPAVLLVGGSGPADRDNGGYFIPIRDALVDHGVGVFSYDKRGSGGAEGKWENATVDDLAGDAIAGLAMLRECPEVDDRRISLFGHSEGGWVALRVGVTSELPFRLILSSTPAVSFIDAEIHALKSNGFNDVECGSARRLFDELADLAQSSANGAKARQQVASYGDQDWFVRLEDGGFRLTDPMWAQFCAWCRYDPEPDLRRCTSTTTVFLGAADPLVPIAESIEVLNATAHSSGRTQSIHVVPDVGHRMAVSDGQDPVPEYLEILNETVRTV